MAASWFEVDKAGLAKLLVRKGKAFALFELIQNAWDTNATRVDVTLARWAGNPYVDVRVVDDDPQGFSKLEHAFTLFAESDKKADAEKRGRFNLGEKLVLALCRTATITSTTGVVVFDSNGRRRSHRPAGGLREKGSEFFGTMRMTKVELDEVHAALQTLIPPVLPMTYVNSVALPRRPAFRVVKGVSLQTEIGDAEGFLRKTVRQTSFSLHETLAGETARLYEMGIPVVELPGDRWHVNIGQKIPLTIDRDNVTPAYLRSVRVEVLNAASDLLVAEDATTPWVRDAAGDARAERDAVEKVTTLRFGARRVIADPSDPEGTKLAVSKGYTVITGGALSKDEWENVKRYQAALPAGQVTPSPRPYSEDGRPEKIVPREEWTDDMMRFHCRVQNLSLALIQKEVVTRFVREPGVYWQATFGGLGMAVNLSKVSQYWFDDNNAAGQLKLVIHELAHHYASDHLSSAYHEALCDLGARLAVLPGNLWGLRKPM
jgi:hypothetical protein